MNLFTKQKETHRFREQTYSSQGRKMGEGIVRVFEMDVQTLLFFKWISNKNLLYSTGNSAQYYVADWKGGEFGEEWIHGLNPSLLNCSQSLYPLSHQVSLSRGAVITHLQLTFGEGNSNPLQCSCLENPSDGGAWWAAVYGVAQSRT